MTKEIRHSSRIVILFPVSNPLEPATVVTVNTICLRLAKVLRFSRLFGIKPNLRFKKWKGMKKQKPVKTEATTSSGGEVDEAADAARELERAMERHTNIGPDGEWKFDYAPYPDDPNAYAEDQASTRHSASYISIKPQE